MTLTDTGPLVAILDRRDSSHGACLKVLSNLSKPLITTLPALTESIYFLGQEFDWHGQSKIWEMMKESELEIAELDQQMYNRMAELMEKYQDSPMDFADASLIAVAEARKLRHIFTLDSHFRIYRLRNEAALTILP